MSHLSISHWHPRGIIWCPTIAQAQLWVLLNGGWPLIALLDTVFIVEYDGEGVP